MSRLIWRAMNWLRGLGYQWDGETFQVKPGTCPYPLHPDWSVKRCVRNGDCGCSAADDGGV